MLKIEGLYKTFTMKDGKRKTAIEAVKDVSLHVPEGKVISVLGPSGSGKSTLLRCVNFLEKAESGKITLDGQEIDVSHASKGDVRFIQRSTAMVFQNYNLFQNKTALENVMAGLLIRNIPKGEAAEKSRHFLNKVGMSDKENEYPSRLSGGQQQRVGIARALALEPKVILMDEPTSALDPELVGEVKKVIAQVVNENQTMLIVTHELDFARQISDQVALFNEGNIIEINETELFFKAPQKERTKKFLEGYFENFVANI